MPIEPYIPRPIYVSYIMRSDIRTTVWLLDETLTIAYHNELMANYPVTYQPDGHHFAHIADLQNLLPNAPTYAALDTT